MIFKPFPDNDITQEEKVYIAEIQEKLRALELAENGSSDVSVDGIYGPKTTEAVRRFQTRYGLAATGTVDRDTYYKLVEVYNRLLADKQRTTAIDGFIPSDGVAIRPQDTGDAVLFLNIMLRSIATVFKNIPIPVIESNYSPTTQAAVSALQSTFNLPTTGITNRNTWNRITDLYNDLVQDLYLQTVSPSRLEVNT